MLFTTLFQRLTSYFEPHPKSLVRYRAPRARRATPPRPFVPQLTVLEDRALPSATHKLLSGIIAHTTPAFTAPHTHGVHFQEHLTLGDSGHPADTRVVPFKVTGGGNAPAGLPVIPGATAPHDATGTATELGKYTGQGVFTLDSIDFSTLTGTFHGTFTFVAANGDKLVMSYGTVTPGLFSLTPPAADGTVVAQFVAVFTPIPGQSTGRFANVIGGSFVMIATSAPFVLSVNAQGYTPAFTYTWEGQGTLEFAKG
jgi:hypothetical protein